MTEAGRTVVMARGRVRLVVVAVAVAMVLSACNWTQFRADPGHSGFQPLESKISTANVGNLVHSWGTSSGSGVTTPTVANGTVYVGGPRLNAFDTAGVRRWSADLGRSIDGFPSESYSTPAVADGVVYVGSFNGKLYAFDAAGVKGCSGVPKTCAALWTAFVGGAGLGGVRTSPNVVNGVVYVASVSGGLSAIDAAGVKGCSGVPKTCAPLWTAPADGLAFASPAVANGVVYTASYLGVLAAFDAAGVQGCSGVPKTCRPLWTARPSSTETSPVVVDGMVYVSAGSLLHAFDAAGVRNCSGVPKTCTPVWSVFNDARGYSAPAVAGGVLYVGSSNGTLQAIDAATGTLKWSAAGFSAFSAYSAPAVANGVVYVGEGPGYLLAYDAAGVRNCSSTAKTCAPLYTSGFIGTGAPSVADGVVYLATDTHELHAFRL